MQPFTLKTFRANPDNPHAAGVVQLEISTDKEGVISYGDPSLEASEALLEDDDSIELIDVTFDEQPAAYQAVCSAFTALGLPGYPRRLAVATSGRLLFAY